MTTYLFEVYFRDERGELSYDHLRAENHENAKQRFETIFPHLKFAYASRIGN